MVAGFRKILVSFVIFTAICLAMLLLLFNTMINGVPGNTNNFTADFTTTSGLASGDDVRVAGVRVGKVTGIELKNGLSHVTFQLQNTQPILDNTQVVMRYANLIGQRYLSLVQGKDMGTALHPDANIPTSRTSPGFDLTELLNGFRPLLDVLQPADVNKLAGSIIQVLQGEGPSIEQLMQQTTQFTTFIANRDQVIGDVLQNLIPVLQDMAGHGDQLAGTVKQLEALMTAFASDRQQIGDSITNLSTLISSTSDLLVQARTPIVADTKLLRGIVETTAQNKALLVQGLGAFGDVFNTLGKITSYENAANIYLCSLTIDLGVTKVNLSGNANGGPYTGACQ